MIKTDNLTFQYQGAEQVFQFPNLDLMDDDHLLIVGKSGVGKTTLLHILSGLLRPKSGTVSIDEIDISQLSENSLDAFRGKSIGIVFQKNYAIQSLTVFENLKSKLFFAKNKINNQTINQLLIDLDLHELKHRKTNQLSVGQLQRLGIAMSVVHKPKIILADEPTSSLDDESCATVIQLLKEQAKKNKANLVVITHDNRIKEFFNKSIAL